MSDSSPEYRAVFISDVHLGSAGCQATQLLEFLTKVRSDALYLVGDIVDLESLSRRFYWPQVHNDVLRAILGHARRGMRVVYVPGNHDIQARAWSGRRFGRVEVRRQLVHNSADGRRLLVMHGDALDRSIGRDTWLSQAGSAAYRQLVRVNNGVNGLRQWAGLDYWPLASALKHRSRAARQYMSRFRDRALALTRERGFDGCVMGHIHRPEIVTRDGVTYMNCGDWVEHCTALVEYADGRFDVLDRSCDRMSVTPLPRRRRVSLAKAA